MPERKFVHFIQKGNVSYLPRDFYKQSRALTVYKEPKVPAVYMGAVVGLAALLLLTFSRKD